MSAKRLKRSDRLLGILGEFREIMVIMHNNPDPDAIAAGWAILTLVSRRIHKPVRLIGRGPILRAENRQFVNLLKPPLELVDNIQLDASTATVLVDCSPASFNHLLGGHRAPTAVIDHHESRKDGFRIPYRDLRPKATASASITAEYLREQSVNPSAEMATALVYAIRSEMIGAGKALVRVDHTALRWLSGFANYDVLSGIENPPLPLHHYEELLWGLESVFIFEDSACCFLPRISAPEIVGEFADLLIRYEKLQRVLCSGRLGDDFLFSARSKGNDRTALDLVGRVIGDLGHFGGHLHRAGGKICVTTCGKTPEQLDEELRARWNDACGSTSKRGTRFIEPRSLERPS